ncbi:conjugal transfer protein TraL [Cohaesibacter celericrescens]|nr:conjugal transfer protein TraL [Cohaesibacter celericrescens]
MNEKTFHLVLQAKGGIGKSLTASILAQYFLNHGDSVTAIDGDPSSPTISAIPGLNAVALQIVDQDEINPRRFDEMMETVIEAEEGAQIVCDIGASSYIAFVSYLAQNHAIELLQDSDIRVLIHSPICGGQAFEETLNGLAAMIDLFVTAEFVVWENEFFGPVSRNGLAFRESKFYLRYADRIVQFLSHPRVHQATFGEDMREMMQRKLTFDAAIASPDFNIMARQRLKQIWTAHCKQLDGSILSVDDTVEAVEEAAQ